MMEPEQLRMSWRQSRMPASFRTGLVEFISARIRWIGILPLPAPRARDAKRIVTVSVLFHVKEEVKLFGGVPQLSPTRFFDMEHEWRFVRMLPSIGQEQELRTRGEKIPFAPWRLAQTYSFYPKFLAMDPSSLKKEDEEEEEDDDEEEEQDDDKRGKRS